MGRRYLFLSIILHLVAPLLEREEEEKKQSGISKKRRIPKALGSTCPTFQSHFKANPFPVITFPNHCPRT